MDGYQTKRVLALLDCEDELSEWEWDFVNSIADRNEELPLSEKQQRVLNKLSERLRV